MPTVTAHNHPAARTRVPQIPGPSRLRYRWERLWLTPAFRALIRTGLPSFTIVAFVALWLQNPVNSERFNTWLQDMRGSVVERPEFTLQSMAITGASRATEVDLRHMVAIRFPISSFDLNLEEIRAHVAGHPAVLTAQVQVSPGGILEIAVTERRASFLWRTSTGLYLVDASGVTLRAVPSRAGNEDLALVAGDGADEQLGEAATIFDLLAGHQDRLRGLIRVGERRWDVILSGDLRIQLPEKDGPRVLDALLTRDSQQNLLSRNIRVIDLRSPDRPTLRLGDGAYDEIVAQRGPMTGAALQ